MKLVLLQDRTASLESLDSVRDLLQNDLKENELEIEITNCLSNINHYVKDYVLIISHPHPIYEQDCCMSVLELASKDKIPVIITYIVKRHPHVDEIEAIGKIWD